MVREIVLYGEPVLRRRSKPVARINARTLRLIDDLFETMTEAHGLGLAAPQVDVAQRVIVVHDGESEPFAVVNPQIKSRSGSVEGVEGCLSIPGLQGMVPRSRRITVAGLDTAGRTVRIEAEDLLARVLQHEIDHLNGVLFVDHTDDIWWLEEVADDEEVAPEGIVGGYEEEEEDGAGIRLQRLPTDLAEVERYFAELRSQRQRAEAAGS